MATRVPRLQTVDLIRHLPDRQVIEVIEVSATEDQPNAACFVASLTDLVSPVVLRAQGRNLLIPELLGLWVVFVDEHSRLDRAWFDLLAQDLHALASDHEVACSVGAGHCDGSLRLDVAYRRSALEYLGGFAASDDWSIDLEAQARLVACGYAVRGGIRDQVC